MENQDFIREVNILAGRDLAHGQIILTLIGMITAITDSEKTEVLDKVISELESYCNRTKSNYENSKDKSIQKESLISGMFDTLEVLKQTRERF